MLAGSSPLPRPLSAQMSTFLTIGRGKTRNLEVGRKFPDAHRSPWIALHARRPQWPLESSMMLENRAGSCQFLSIPVRPARGGHCGCRPLVVFFDDHNTVPKPKSSTLRRLSALMYGRHECRGAVGMAFTEPAMAGAAKLLAVLTRMTLEAHP